MLDNTAYACIVMHGIYFFFFSDSIVSLKDSEGNNDLVIAICFASIMAVSFIVASYCYCYRFKKKRKDACDTPKGERNFCSMTYRQSESYHKIPQELTTLTTC